MGNRYRQLAVNPFKLFLLLLTLPVITQAAPPVIPQTLDYEVRPQGIPFSINATRTLRQNDQGLWTLQIRASNFLGEIRETSQFRWHDCVPRTEQYSYLRRGLGRVREAQVAFDRDSRIARSERSNRPQVEYAFADDTTDDLALSLWLQCALSQGETDISVQVGDDRKVEQQHYQVIGEERLRIDGKRLDTIKVQRLREPSSPRQTYMWFAPSLNYTLVQLIQDEDGSEHRMTLKSLN